MAFKSPLVSPTCSHATTEGTCLVVLWPYYALCLWLLLPGFHMKWNSFFHWWWAPWGLKEMTWEHLLSCQVTYCVSYWFLWPPCETSPLFCLILLVGNRSSMISRWNVSSGAQIKSPDVAIPKVPMVPSTLYQPLIALEEKIEKGMTLRDCGHSPSIQDISGGFVVLA